MLIYVSPYWLADNDYELHDIIMFTLKKFANDPQNLASEEDVKKFLSNEYIIEICYCEDGTVGITAGKNKQELADQPFWFRGEIRNWIKEDLEKKLFDEGEIVK